MSELENIFLLIGSKIQAVYPSRVDYFRGQPYQEDETPALDLSITNETAPTFSNNDAALFVAGFSLKAVFSYATIADRTSGFFLEYSRIRKIFYEPDWKQENPAILRIYDFSFNFNFSESGAAAFSIDTDFSVEYTELNQ